jgi:hypothetical protein
MIAHHKLLAYPISLLAIVTPWWLPVLEQASQYAALLMPIAGLSYLSLQIFFAIARYRHGRH